MTNFLGTVFKTVAVVLSAIVLPVEILIGTILGTGIILYNKFIKKIDIGFKEYFSWLFDRTQTAVKGWLDVVTALYAKD